jgi:predicted permease
MWRLRRFLLRLDAFLRTARAERELTREVSSHLALLQQEFERRGMNRETARLAARRAFGGVAQAKEQQRDARSFLWLEDLRRDVRIGLRALARERGFSSVVLFTLALGIGATTAIVTVVYGVLLRPLPYQDPHGLVHIVENVPAAETSRGVAELRTLIDRNHLWEWRARTKTLSHMAEYSTTPPMALETPEGGVRVTGARVSALLFPLLGVRPILGRPLVPADEAGNGTTVLISAATWMRYFRAAPDIVGRTIALEARRYTVVGVMPARFDFPNPAIAFWIPIQAGAPVPGRTTFVNVLARLQTGISLDAAALEADVIGRQLRGGIPLVTSGPPRFGVVRMLDHLVAHVRPALRVLLFSAGVVLLIVCANVATLLLARGTARQREIAIRCALGAGRGRVLRQVLTESMLLSIGGGLAGLAAAYAGVYLLRALAAVDVPELFQLADRARFGSSVLIPRLDAVALNTRVLVFALTASIAIGMLVGLAPAVQLSTLDDARMLEQRRIPPARGASRGRKALVVAQLVLATMLLVGAGLLIGSFVKLSNVDTGYDASSVLTFQLVLPPRYPAPRKAAVAHDLAARLTSIGGVRAAGFTNAPPLAGATLYTGVLTPPGRTVEQMLRDPARPQTRSVTPGYLPALGVRLLEGRWLDEHDGSGQPRVALVNRALARRYFGAASPVGAALRQLPAGDRWEIVGVVDDVRQGRLDEEPYPQVFMDSRQLLAGASQTPGPPPDLVALGLLSFAVRVSGDPMAIVPDLRAVVQAVEPSAILDSVIPMERLVSASTVRPRFYATLFGIFAGIAAALAAVGVYGLLSYLVTQRTSEIGVRMTLGARPADVRNLVLRQGAALIAMGIPLGIIGAVGATRYLSALLFGLTPLDPPTYAFAVALFTAVALAACYIPSRRATRVDPLVALRSG